MVEATPERVAELQRLVMALAERVLAQHEVIARLAERGSDVESESKCKLCYHPFVLHTPREWGIDGEREIFECPSGAGFVTPDQFDPPPTGPADEYRDWVELIEAVPSVGPVS